MGFSGYWVKVHQPVSPQQEVQVATGPVHKRGPGHWVAQSDQYFSELLTQFNWTGSNIQRTATSNVVEPGKKDETVPVLAKASPVKLVFCFPGDYHTGALQSVISNYQFALKAKFNFVIDLPISQSLDWEDKLGDILNREQPKVFIGFNVNYHGFGRNGITVHLYIAMVDEWQRILMPQLIARVSSTMDDFSFAKRNLGGRDIYEIRWNETSGEYLYHLQQNLEMIVKLLEQVPELRTMQPM
jgi:hypothetical protein